jgi:large subunit ribosomal protein L2
MGKRIRVQRRGRGSPIFEASSHKRIAPAQYIPYSHFEQEPVLEAVVEDLLHESGRGSPLAKLRLNNGRVFYNVVPEGVSIGQKIFLGLKSPIQIGNVLRLSEIPSGTLICNIEIAPGDGGKVARSSGTYATVVAHTPAGTQLKLPSGKSIYVNGSCRATIGVVSGGGRTEKPFLKAGKKVHWKRSKGHKYPMTKGVAMIAAVHPHGGGAHKSSSLKPTTVSRDSPPGQKVGLIAARQSGRKKRRRI